jgi:hypothetical protein
MGQKRWPEVDVCLRIDIMIDGVRNFSRARCYTACQSGGRSESYPSESRSRPTLEWALGPLKR